MRRSHDLLASAFTRDPGVGFWSHLWFTFLIWLGYLNAVFLMYYPGRMRFPEEIIPEESLGLLDRSQKPVGIVTVFRKNTFTNRALTLGACRIVWDVFGVPVRLLGLSIARDERMDGDRMLNRIGDERYLKNYSRVLVLTDVDLFAENHRWVYGYAGTHIPGCAVSAYRLGLDSENPWKVHRNAWRRALRVIMHELGHTYGLRHCPYDSCIMHDVPDTGLNDLHPKFCSSCRVLIRSVRRGTRRRHPR